MEQQRLSQPILLLIAANPSPDVLRRKSGRMSTHTLPVSASEGFPFSAPSSKASTYIRSAFCHFGTHVRCHGLCKAGANAKKCEIGSRSPELRTWFRPGSQPPARLTLLGEGQGPADLRQGRAAEYGEAKATGACYTLIGLTFMQVFCVLNCRNSWLGFKFPRLLARRFDPKKLEIDVGNCLDSGFGRFKGWCAQGGSPEHPVATGRGIKSLTNPDMPFKIG